MTDDPAAHLRTVRDFIRWGASRMNAADLHFGHGTVDAIDESAALVLHALHLPADLHHAYFEAALTPDEKAAVLALFARRIDARVPAPYLTQRAWFGGLPYYVDERVLIPRSPIAELIEARFQPWLEPEHVTAILDLCTGSGCIGIACAHAFPEAEVDLVDISADALEVARINIEDHGVGERVAAIRSDLFAGLGGRCYDLIVSNPPYVGAGEMAELPPEYAHEPALALAAEDDGLAVVLTILRDAPAHLSAHGVLVVEVGNSQHALVERFPQVPFLWLEFERGGDGVFLLTARQLREHAAAFAAGV